MLVLEATFRGGVRGFFLILFATWNFFPFEKKELLTTKNAKNRVRFVAGRSIVRESHRANLKKQGGKRFLSLSYGENLISLKKKLILRVKNKTQVW